MLEQDSEQVGKNMIQKDTVHLLVCFLEGHGDKDENIFHPLVQMFLSHGWGR